MSNWYSCNCVDIICTLDATSSESSSVLSQFSASAKSGATDWVLYTGAVILLNETELSLKEGITGGTEVIVKSLIVGFVSKVIVGFIYTGASPLIVTLFSLIIGAIGATGKTISDGDVKVGNDSLAFDRINSGISLGKSPDFSFILFCNTLIAAYNTTKYSASSGKLAIIDFCSIS